MARYNEILVGRYNRRLQKLFSMKGEPPAPQLSTEIGTTLNLFSGIEERYLEGWAVFSLHVNNTVGAGVNAGVRFRNPVASKRSRTPSQSSSGSRSSRRLPMRP